MADLLQYLTLANWNEKAFFCLSFLPPLCFTLLTVWVLHGKPQWLLENFLSTWPYWTLEDSANNSHVIMLKPIGMGLDPMTLIDKIEHDIEASPGAFKQLLTRFSARNKLDQSGEVEALSESDVLDSPDLRRQAAMPPAPKSPARQILEAQGLLPATPGPWAQEEVKEGSHILIHVGHLKRTAFVPLWFVWSFFWDSALIHRDASLTFPLMNCLKEDYCFFIKQEYNVFRYPTYERLKCQQMGNESLTTGTFSWRADPDARFYKCYEIIGEFSGIVGAFGDSLALMAVAFLIIIYGSVQSLDRDKQRGKASGILEDNLFFMRKRRHLRRVAALLLVFFFWSFVTIRLLYGRVTNDIIYYMFLPGILLWSLLLTLNRLELIEAQLEHPESCAELRGGDSEEGGGDSSDDSAELTSPAAEDHASCFLMRAVDFVLDWVFVHAVGACSSPDVAHSKKDVFEVQTHSRRSSLAEEPRVSLRPTSSSSNSMFRRRDGGGPLRPSMTVEFRDRLSTGHSIASSFAVNFTVPQMLSRGAHPARAAGGAGHPGCALLPVDQAVPQRVPVAADVAAS